MVRHQSEAVFIISNKIQLMPEVVRRRGLGEGKAWKQLKACLAPMRKCFEICKFPMGVQAYVSLHPSRGVMCQALSGR